MRFLGLLEAEYPNRSDPATPAPEIAAGENEPRDNFLGYFGT